MNRNLPAKSGDLALFRLQEDSTCHEEARPVSHNYRAEVLQVMKPTHLEPVLHKRRHHNEKFMHLNKEQPPLTITREDICAATKTQLSQINNKIKLKSKQTYTNGQQTVSDTGPESKNFRTVSHMIAAAITPHCHCRT